MDEPANKRLALTNALRRAAARNELTLNYQPQLDIHSWQIVGTEALLRWTHPEFGTVSSADFIPMAEESGLIVPIGEWVLRSACAQNKAWREQGLPNMMVGVNVSAMQFQSRNLTEVVLRALDQAGLNPESLELEITESIAMNRTGPTLSALHELKALGLRFSIDDFGTGYSSLSQLKCCPVSKLKIDQSFVRNLTSDPIDDAIVRAIIFLGHSLKMRVIAEGVETGRQLALLKSYGCDEIQGFLLSRPVVADKIPSVIRELRNVMALQEENDPTGGRVVPELAAGRAF